MAGEEDRMKGQWEEAKGKAKQAWGDMTDNERARSEGQMEEAKGEGRQTWGKAKDKAEDLFDRKDNG